MRRIDYSVSDIPQQWGDVYPTIELIDRLHPPQGKELRYPIPIEITAADLRLALTGKYVTRVIYVEDPHRALARPRPAPEQRYVDALAHEDPLHVAVCRRASGGHLADGVGRPRQRRSDRRVSCSDRHPSSGIRCRTGPYRIVRASHPQPAGGYASGRRYLLADGARCHRS